MHTDLLALAHAAGIECSKVMLLTEATLWAESSEWSVNLFQSNQVALKFTVAGRDERGDIACYTLHPADAADQLYDPALWSEMAPIVAAAVERVRASA